MVYRLIEVVCKRDALLKQKIMPLASSLVPVFLCNQLVMKVTFRSKISYDNKGKRARETAEHEEEEKEMR